MSFTSEIAQTLAAHKQSQNQPIKQTLPGQVGPSGNMDPHGVGIQKMGEGVGKFLGSLIKKARYDRSYEGVTERMTALKKHFDQMPDVYRQKFIQQEAIQQKLKEAQGVRPGLFDDASRRWDNPELEGLIDFPKSVRTPEERQVRGEAKQPYKEGQAYKGREAAIGKVGADTSKVKQGVKFDKELQPTKVVQAGEDVKLTKGQTALAWARVRALDRTNTDVNEESSKTERQEWKQFFDQRLASSKQLHKIYEDYGTSIPVEFATQDVQHSKAMIDSMDWTAITVGDISIPIPAAITSPLAMQWINKSIDEAFMTAQRYQSDEGQREKLQLLYTEVMDLYKKSYAPLMQPQIVQNIPEFTRQFIDPQVIEKLSYIKLIAGLVPLEKQKAVRERLRKNFPIAEPEQPGKIMTMWNNLWNEWSY